MKDGDGKERLLNTLARDIDHNAQTSILTSFGHKFRGDKFGYRRGQVDAIDEDVDYCSQQNPPDGSGSKYNLPSRISWKGPPLAVSAISHLTMLSLFALEFQHS